MSIRYPAPLQAGDRIGVTSPSAGVSVDLRPRLDVSIEHLRAAGYEVVVGACMDGAGVVSAPAKERAAELLGVESLREVTALDAALGRLAELLPADEVDVVRRRVQHVVTENARVELVTRCLLYTSPSPRD